MLLGALDHFDIVAEHPFGPFDQCAHVTAIHKYLDDGIEAAEQPHPHRPPRRVPLAPFDLLARTVTAPPPFSAVLADCESMIATVGVGLRPAALRPCSLKDLVTRSQVPRKRQARNC